MIAAIVYSPGQLVEELLSDVAHVLQGQGVRVGGLVQHSFRDHSDSRCRIELENLDTGAMYPLTQNLGMASQSCALDIRALADASAVLRQAVIDQDQLVIVNKFGGQEAAGSGLRAEMAEIAMAGLPLLTSVAERFLPQWHAFVGDEMLLLPVSKDRVLAWWRNLQAGARLRDTTSA